MLASIYEDGRVSAMRLFTVENSQPVLGETVYSYSVNDDGEETVTTFGRAYTKHSSTEEYISSTDSVKTKSSLSWNGWEVLNTESESDFFGRTTGKHYTVNLGEDDHPNFGTEYTYADTETTATNKISRVKNTLNGAVKSDYGYTYDNRGNILTVSKSGVLFQQYVYDEASQVKAEYNYAEKTAMTYVYDANGNIVSKTPYTNVTSSDLSTATQGTAIVYGYGDGNWSDKLTSYDGQTISYDASGNPTSYRGETVTWNGRLMTSFTKDDRRYEYSYNSDGMRTVKRVYEGDELVYTYTYIWDGDVLLAGRMEVTDADEPITIRYLYDDSGELYGMDYNGNGYFSFIKNLQGDIVSIIPLDSESNVEVNMEYDAWGKPIYVQGSSLAEGFMMAVLMAVTNVGYRGYFYDFDTGLYYLRSRYYDPEIGRFINADDTGYLGYDDTPLSMNLFAYCENNPVKYKDEKGYAKTPLWFLRKQAQKKVIDAMKDDYAKVIVEQWFYGGGKKYETARTRMDWSSYMTKNKKLKNKIIGYASSALKSKKTSFSKKKDSLTLSDSGHGGYFTGYDLLNGSDYNYGGFEAEGSIRKIGNKKYRVLFTFVFNDFVNPNERYRSDIMWKKIMKNVVLYKGQGIDYVIKVSGGGCYDFTF